MAKTPRWTMGNVTDGVLEVSLSSWKYFHDFIRQIIIDYPHYVWRGQRDGAWKLETGLDRALRGTPISGREEAVALHLEEFKMAARGRRGPNPSRIELDDEWWALAQHHGMATPLLDWTTSPFVALYFAFHKEEVPASGKRAVWALGDISGINDIASASHVGSSTKGPAPLMQFVRPAQDDNSRLVAQGGLFTKGPIQKTVDDWVREHQAGVTNPAALLKIVVPSDDRPECLRTLNRMNINHSSLFPDLFGAGMHCNTRLKIKKY